MINLFTIVNNEIDNYFGHYNQAEREKYYLLNDEEYESFLEGCSFNNSKFILADKYQLKEKREYKGFSKEEDKKLQ